MKKMLILTYVLLISFSGFGQITFSDSTALTTTSLSCDTCRHFTLAMPYYTPLKDIPNDTIPCLLLVCDTLYQSAKNLLSMITPNIITTDNLDIAFRFENYVYWLYGFRVEKYVTKRSQYGEYYRVQEIEYIRADKNKFPNNIIVWLSK